MKILIIDAYTPDHIGCGALLNNSIKIIKQAFDKPQIEISGFLPKTIEQYAKLRTLPWLYYTYFPFEIKNRIALLVINNLLSIEWVVWKHLIKAYFFISNKLKFKFDPLLLTFLPRRRQAAKAYMNADVIISISGEGMNENLGFLDKYIFFYQFALMLGKKLSFFPQTIGPVFSEKYKRKARDILNQCALVVPRDEFSYQFLNNLGLKKGKQVGVIPDVGILQDYIFKEEARQILLNIERIKMDSNSKIIGVCISKWVDSDTREKQNSLNYTAEITKFITYLIELGYLVLIMPANYAYYEGMDGPQIDSILCTNICQQINDTRVNILKRRYTPEEYKGILSLLDAFITTRMHTAILATMALTPTITIATQSKLRGYMRNIDQENFVIDMNEVNVSKLVEKFNELLINRNSIIKSLEQKRKHIQKDVLKIIKFLNDCIDN